MTAHTYTPGTHILTNTHTTLPFDLNPTPNYLYTITQHLKNNLYAAYDQHNSRHLIIQTNLDNSLHIYDPENYIFDDTTHHNPTPLTNLHAAQKALTAKEQLLDTISTSHHITYEIEAQLRNKLPTNTLNLTDPTNTLNLHTIPALILEAITQHTRQLTQKTNTLLDNPADALTEYTDTAPLPTPELSHVSGQYGDYVSTGGDLLILEGMFITVHDTYKRQQTQAEPQTLQITKIINPDTGLVTLTDSSGVTHTGTLGDYGYTPAATDGNPEPQSRQVAIHPSATTYEQAQADWEIVYRKTKIMHLTEAATQEYEQLDVAPYTDTVTFDRTMWQIANHNYHHLVLDANHVLDTLKKQLQEHLTQTINTYMSTDHKIITTQAHELAEAHRQLHAQ